MFHKATTACLIQVSCCLPLDEIRSTPMRWTRLTQQLWGGQGQSRALWGLSFDRVIKIPLKTPRFGEATRCPEPWTQARQGGQLRGGCEDIKNLPCSWWHQLPTARMKSRGPVSAAGQGHVFPWLLSCSPHSGQGHDGVGLGAKWAHLGLVSGLCSN